MPGTPDEPFVKWSLREGRSISFLHLPRQQFLVSDFEGGSLNWVAEHRSY